MFRQEAHDAIYCRGGAEIHRNAQCNSSEDKPGDKLVDWRLYDVK